MFLDKRGYTLIELIVVLVLIGLVLTLAAPPASKRFTDR